ncbi:MAG: creatininase family protein [Acidobacteriaceae bacterium]
MIKMFAALLVTLATASLNAQPGLSSKWEELTAADFVKAIAQAQGTCVLPIGIIEKHGPHLPLGTDLLNVRAAVAMATKQEYSVVFPEYYFGQIFEAKHQPGTVAYSLDMQLHLLQETTDEMGRNGCKKVLIVNGHGGNESLLPLFGQAQLATPHDYVVFVFGLPNTNLPGRPSRREPNDMHAGESESSTTLVTHPELVHMDRAGQQSGADQNRLTGMPDNVYTGIWWYAKFPNHYAGDGSKATKELGDFELNAWSAQIAGALKAVKADVTAARLQREFYEQSKHPLDKKQ